MMTTEQKAKPIFRVFWQSLFNLHSKFTYPAQGPYLTYTQAEDEVKRQMASGTKRAYVVGPDGHIA